jgi:glycosyltransferase involved in cell wall biosynthesis
MSSLIALLGRCDVPVDGVEDYCTFLGEALAPRNRQLKKVSVEWSDAGWARSLHRLWRASEEWRGTWVALQYTALAWSRRGFPFGALAVLGVLRLRRARCAVVFHEPYSQIEGSRWIDRIRGLCQDWVIRRLYYGAERSIFTEPLNRVGWLPPNDRKAVFIPIGANIPEPQTHSRTRPANNGAAKTVAVFCLSSPPMRQGEVKDICSAVRFAVASCGKLRIVFLGRETADAQGEIVRNLEGVPVEVFNFGVRAVEEISDTLAKADAMLCVRGPLYPRRGSALAGVACGLPIVGYEGAAAGTPLEEAGIALVPYKDSKALGAALARVLTDDGFRAALRERSRRAHEKHFCWSIIARQYAESLGSVPPEKPS